MSECERLRYDEGLLGFQHEAGVLPGGQKLRGRVVMRADRLPLTRDGVDESSALTFGRAFGMQIRRDAPSARLQHSANFGQDTCWLSDVLEHETENRDRERRIAEREGSGKRVTNPLHGLAREFAAGDGDHLRREIERRNPAGSRLQQPSRMPTGPAAHVEGGLAADRTEPRAYRRFLDRDQRVAIIIIERRPRRVAFLNR